jgi:hypothetical protein
MMRQMGNKCACCGATQGLEFDVIRPTGQHHARLEYSVRTSYYLHQFRQGNLQILCKPHNVIKAARLISLSDLLREGDKSNNSTTPSSSGT